MKKRLIAYLGAVTVASTLSASAVTTELALVIDGSGSINPADFTTQQTGYVNALNTLITPSRYGEVAIGVWQFSTAVQLEQTPIVINNAADLATVTGAIAGMTQLGGSTNISGAITTAAGALLGNAINFDRTIIDVSTDGEQFPAVAGEPDASADAAILAGIDQVNGLGIGGGADLSWVPAGSQSFVANSFAEFEAVVLQKIGREVGGVPEGGNILPLFGLVVFGMGMYNRRRKAQA